MLGPGCCIPVTTCQPIEQDTKCHFSVSFEFITVSSIALYRVGLLIPRATCSPRESLPSVVAVPRSAACYNTLASRQGLQNDVVIRVLAEWSN